MPTPYSTEEIGQAWWDAYTQLQNDPLPAYGDPFHWDNEINEWIPASSGFAQYGGGFWDEYLNPLLGGSTMEYYGDVDPEQYTYNAASGMYWGFPTGIMQNFGNLFSELNIDPSAHYRIGTTGELQKDVLTNKFRDEKVKSYLKSIGGSGLASSRYDFSRSQEDYFRELAQNEQLVESSYSDLYSQFGEDFFTQFDLLTTAGAWDPWLESGETSAGDNADWWEDYEDVMSGTGGQDIIFGDVFEQCQINAVNNAQTSGNLNPSMYAGIQDYCYDVAYQNMYGGEGAGTDPGGEDCDPLIPGDCDDIGIGDCFPGCECPDGSCGSWMQDAEGNYIPGCDCG